MAKSKNKNKRTKAEEQNAENEVNGADQSVDTKAKKDGPYASLDRAELEERLEKAEADTAKFRDDFLRLMAEFDNYRKRTRREQEMIRPRAEEEIMAALLPALDDYARTLTALEKTDNLASIRDGLKLVGENFMRALKQRGLEAVESVGADFSVELHEAIHSIPAPDESQKGKVIEEVEKGYHLNGKVIRYAKVIVGE